MTAISTPPERTARARLAVIDSVREPREVELRVEALPRKERLKTALRRLGIAWGLALLAVMVPLLHFVLVPGLLLAGPIFALLSTRRSVRLVVGQVVPCTKCSAPILIDGEHLGWPARLDCPGCGAALTATRAR